MGRRNRKSEGRYIDSSKVRITNEIDTQKEEMEKINKKKVEL